MTLADDAACIGDVVADFCAAYSNRQADDVMALWDTGDPGATYLPAEALEPNIGTAAVSAYVRNACRRFPVLRMRPQNIQARHLSDTIGCAFYMLDWLMDDRRSRLAGSCRVTSLWRKREGNWRLFHYAEAPKAPLVELRTYYEKIAADGLEAIPTRTLPANDAL